MTPEELQTRTFAFAVAIIRLCRELPRSMDGYVVGKQLVKAGTSTAANYRAARRSRSRPEFVARIGVVVEESDESLFWLTLAVAASLLSEDRARPLVQEAEELTRIFAQTVVTARENLRRGADEQKNH